ncbi:MAG TPA: hypothetical protein VMR62_27520 [Bryobacteraceae bacterium]|jgi:hypothetical protein|nr:hypothetical protein [Bryobacteraceae bacterium]
MRELKWQPQQSAELSVLGPGSCIGTARILELSGKRMRLAVDMPSGLQLEGGAAVRLEWDGQLLLGEVLNTEPGGLWMEIQHMLLDTAGLRWQDNGWQHR